MKPAEFDSHAAHYDGGLDNPIKRLMGALGRPVHSREGALAAAPRARPLAAGGLALLDYGCGAGDLMRVLAGIGVRASFTGCDVSTGMLAEDGKRWPAAFGPAPELAVQDGARTPFADGQFDIVTISAVLHHVPPCRAPAVYLNSAGC